MTQPIQKIHFDVALSPEEQHRVVVELEEARTRFKGDKLNTLTSILEQMIVAFRTDNHDFPLEPMPEGSSDEVVANFRAQGIYNEPFLKSLEHGLKRLASSVS